MDRYRQYRYARVRCVGPGSSEPVSACRNHPAGQWLPPRPASTDPTIQVGKRITDESMRLPVGLNGSGGDSALAPALLGKAGFACIRNPDLCRPQPPGAECHGACWLPDQRAWDDPPVDHQSPNSWPTIASGTCLCEPSQYGALPVCLQRHKNALPSASAVNANGVNPVSLCDPSQNG